jgi:two-component system OmpR family response regulator
MFRLTLAKEGDMESTADSSGLHVLIVDADRQTREAILVYFRILGYAGSVAGNAAEAQAAMRKRTFDIIIADYCLPDDDGVSVLRTSFAHQEGAIRILTTAYSCDAYRIQGDLAGIDEVVYKPFTGDELRDRIERHACWKIARIAGPAIPLHL